MAQFKFATALDGGLIIVNIDDIRTLEVVGGGHTKISFDKDHYVTIKIRPPSSAVANLN